MTEPNEHLIPKSRRAPYPGDWYALKDGLTVVEDGSPIVLSTVACGELNMTGGQLIVCDPFAEMRGAGKDAYIPVPKGRFPVVVTLADVSGKSDGSHLREAYATLVFADRPEVERQQLSLLAEGAQPTPLAPGDMWVFAVDAGTACFADKTSIDRDMPDPATWYPDLFENEHASCWFKQMDDPDHLREGLANITLPSGDGTTNIVIIHSGWGDGLYPVIGGFDENGRLVAVHIDFLVVGGPPDDTSEDASNGDAVEVEAYKPGRMQCPKCNKKFSLKDPHRWDGSKHLTCGQKIIPTPYIGREKATESPSERTSQAPDSKMFDELSNKKPWWQFW